MNEHRKRSLVKAITWRVIASLATFTIVFLFTGEWILSLGVGMLDVIIKFILYYAHERGWNLIKWGKNQS